MCDIVTELEDGTDGKYCWLLVAVVSEREVPFILISWMNSVNVNFDRSEILKEKDSYEKNLYLLYVMNITSVFDSTDFEL